jgi:GH18 family chitinase
MEYTMITLGPRTRILGLAILISVIVGMAPFTAGTPASGILHALVRVGHGDSRADWLATTPDSFPLFTLGVLVVYRKLLPALMSIAPLVLLGIGGVALKMVLDALVGKANERISYAAGLILLCLYSALTGWLSTVFVGLDLRTVWSGDPGMGFLPGTTFRPESAGIFFLVALAFLAADKPYHAIVAAGIPGSFHPAFALPAGVLAAVGVVYALRQRKRFMTALGLAALALLPTVFSIWFGHRAYNLSNYAPQQMTPSMNFWAPNGEIVLTIGRAAIVGLAAYMLRGTRLFPAFAAAAAVACIALLSLVLQVSRPDWAIAFVHPSVPLVEAGTAVVVVNVLLRLTRPRPDGEALLTPGVFWFVAGLLAVVGGVRTGFAFTNQGYGVANRLYAAVRASTSGDEIYAIPTSLKGFRAATGAATVVDDEALPAQPSARGEWETRRRAVSAMFEADTIRCEALQNMSTMYGMTRIVISQGGPVVACPHGDTVFHDDRYTLLHVPGWHRPVGMPHEYHAPWLTGYYGYWGEEEMPPHAMRYERLTHIVHFFARPTMDASPFFGPVVNTRDSTQLIWGTDHYTAGTYNVTDSLITYAHRHGVKVVLSVGGIYGGQAEIIDFVTRDSARTQAFVDAALAFSRRHGYDGVELDWEKPTSVAQVSLMVRRLRAGLDAWPSRGSLLVASAAWDLRLKMYPPALIASSIDQFNIMCYDMHMPGNLIGSEGDITDVTGFNAPLHRTDSAQYPIVYALSDSYDGVADVAAKNRSGFTILSRGRLRFGPRYAIEVMGVPPEKIGLGIPFYGYLYKNKTAPNQPVDGNKPAYVTYKTTLAALRYGGVRHWDEKAMVPWAAGTATSSIWEWGMSLKPGTPFYVTYDDPESIRLKTKFAKELHLGGVMVYDLWNGWLTDPRAPVRDPLLRAVEEELGN